MQKYEPNEFINSLLKKTNGKEIRACPFCGGKNYTSTELFASILVANDLENVKLGPNIPSGMLICKKCGHMDFFALGALGILPTEEGTKDGTK